MAKHRSHAMKKQAATRHAGDGQGRFIPWVLPFHAGLPAKTEAPHLAWPSYLFEKLINPWRDMRPPLSWMDSWRPSNLHAFPRVESMETDSTYFYRIELPDVRLDQIVLSVHNGAILLRLGNLRASPSQGHPHRRRRFLHRAFSLPAYTDAAAIVAQLEDGVLTVTIPKSARPKPARSRILSISHKGEPTRRPA